MGKKPRGTSREAWGILNPYGDVWTTDVFETPEGAWLHIEDFWHGTPDYDVNRYRVVRVRVHATAVLNNGEVVEAGTGEPIGRTR